MRILQTNNIHTYKPAFGTNFRVYVPVSRKQIFDGNRLGFVRTSTNMFREDLDWNGLVKYMGKHFADKEKVNLYSLASSDGSEAYTLAISLIDKLPSNIHSKMLPIKASDIDSKILKAAASGRINVFNTEFLQAERDHGIDLSKYFTDKGIPIMIEEDEISESDLISSYKLTDKVRDSVKFKKSDILTELRNMIDSGNSVVLCRNVFPYLGENYVNEVIETARTNLKSGSLFIIGEYDCTGGADFKKTSLTLYNKLLFNGFFNPLKGKNNKYILQRL